MEWSLLLLAFATLTFLLAGLVKGVIGVGLPTVVMALLSLTLPPAQAAALLVVPTLVTNVWQALAGPHLRALMRRLWPMLAGICAGTALGGGFIARDDSALAITALGGVLTIYAVIGLTPLRLRLSPRTEPWLGPLAGLVTGLASAATGVFMVPAVPYLQALALDKDELVQAIGLSVVVATVALAALLTAGGIMRAAVIGGSLLALAPAAAGMLIGQLLRNRARPEVFRLCFFVGLLLLGIHLTLRSLL
jgi:hypothetical protein